MLKSMPIVKYFNIELDKSQHVYRAGEAVKGKCHLNIEGMLQLKNLDINLICEGYVDCKETKSDKETMSVLIEKYDLMKRSATDQTLEGFIAIDFSLIIPDKGYPSSFIGKFGFIRYKIEAVVHKDWDLFRKEVLLTVSAPYNGFADEIQVVRTAQKKFGVFNEFIELFAKVDKNWFTPGDKVSVYCNVDNRSDRKLKLSLSLHQKQNYFYTKVRSKISNEETYDYVEPNLRTYSKRILLGIPSNLKTMSLESKVLRISYQIRVLIEFSDLKESLKVELPVILTITPKTYTYPEFDSISLPPSYSDCQNFQHLLAASEDVCLPTITYETKTVDQQLDIKEPESSIIVDLPPSYAEAVFGFNYIR